MAQGPDGSAATMHAIAIFLSQGRPLNLFVTAGQVSDYIKALRPERHLSCAWSRLSIS